MTLQARTPPVLAVRNRAVDFEIRASSFLRHWAFRPSSFAPAWDIDNRLSAKTHDSQALGTADYQYDVLGRRVAKDSGGGSWGKTVTLWWNMREVADYETTGTTPGPIHHYLNLPRHNDRLARTVQVGSSEQVQYYHKNYLDHIYAITDPSGDALEHIRYTAFGLPQHYDFSGLKTATSPTGNQFLWNGKRLDPQLGWYVYHYRHYSPELGGWPSRDPIEEDGGVNLYGFVGNGPLKKIDNLGLFEAPMLSPYNFDELRKRQDEKRERLRPNPFVTSCYFRPFTGTVLEEELAQIDKQGKVTEACDQTQLLAVRESKKGIIRHSLDWNRHSPQWSSGYQCAEQSWALHDALVQITEDPETGELLRPRFLQIPNAQDHWRLDVDQRKRSLRHWPYNKHAVVLVEPNQPAEECCFNSFIIDPFKWKYDNSDWPPAIRFGPPEIFVEHYPRDNNPPE